MKQEIISKMHAEWHDIYTDIEQSESGMPWKCAKNLDRDFRLVDAQIHPGFQKIPRHQQDCIELMYVYDGQVIYGVGEAEVYLAEGDMILLTPKTEHEVFSVDHSAIAISFYVLPEFFDFVAKSLKNRTFDVEFILGMLKRWQIPQTLSFRLKGDRRLENLMENIVLSLADKVEEDAAVLQGTLSVVFMEIFQKRGDFCLFGTFDYNELVAQATLKYLEENYLDASLGDLADRMQMDAVRIGKIIEQKLGHSFYVLQAQWRFQKAVRLLIETDLAIEEIAEQTGNTNLTLFYKQFKHRYGLTPYKFRKKNMDSDNIRL